MNAQIKVGSRVKIVVADINASEADFNAQEIAGFTRSAQALSYIGSEFEVYSILPNAQTAVLLYSTAVEVEGNAILPLAWLQVVA